MIIEIYNSFPFKLKTYTYSDTVKNDRRTSLNARKCTIGFKNFGHAGQGN